MNAMQVCRHNQELCLSQVTVLLHPSSMDCSGKAGEVEGCLLRRRAALGRDLERGALGEGRDGRSLANPVQLLPGREGCYKLGACCYSPPSPAPTAAAAPPDDRPEQSDPIQQSRPLADDGATLASCVLEPSMICFRITQSDGRACACRLVDGLR